MAERITRKRSLHDLRRIHLGLDVLTILRSARLHESQPALHFSEIAKRLGAIELQRYGAELATVIGVGDPVAMNRWAVYALVKLLADDDPPIERVWVDARDERVVYRLLSSPRARWPRNTVFVRAPGLRVRRIHKRRLEGRWRLREVSND